VRPVKKRASIRGIGLILTPMHNAPLYPLYTGLPKRTFRCYYRAGRKGRCFMSPILATVCYGSAIVVSIYLLWHFGVQQWYWHALSILAAFALGLAPLPAVFNRTEFTLVVGWAFTALFVWGVAAPVVSGYGRFSLMQPPGHHHPR
jgi:hypothetical protein